MVTNTRVDTLNLFADLSDSGPFLDKLSIPLPIVLPAFITSELKTAFEIGFLIFGGNFLGEAVDKKIVCNFHFNPSYSSYM